MNVLWEYIFVFLPILSISHSFRLIQLRQPVSHNHSRVRQRRGATPFTFFCNPWSSSLDETLQVPKKQNRTLLVFGNGNVGQAVVKHIETEKKEEFETVYVTTRQSQQEKGNDLDFKNETNTIMRNEKFVRYIPFGNEETQQILRNCTHVLITIPPIISKSDLGGNVQEKENSFSYFDPVLDHPNYIKTLLNPSLQNAWIGYVSTTGVYGDHRGAWVNETSECRPSAMKARCYYDIERRWSEEVLDIYRGDLNNNRTAKKTLLRIFRCAGIYGNDFSALHTVLKKKMRKENISQGKKDCVSVETTPNFTSRIHLDDIARAIVASMLLPNQQQLSTIEIYNLADDEPAPRDTVMDYAISLVVDDELMNKPDEVMIPKDKIGERAKRRGRERKRICNAKMKKQLLRSHDKMKFPTYREGLPSILSSLRENGILRQKREKPENEKFF